MMIIYCWIGTDIAYLLDIFPPPKNEMCVSFALLRQQKNKKKKYLQQQEKNVKETHEICVFFCSILIKLFLLVHTINLTFIQCNENPRKFIVALFHTILLRKRKRIKIFCDVFLKRVSINLHIINEIFIAECCYHSCDMCIKN